MAYDDEWKAAVEALKREKLAQLTAEQEAEYERKYLEKIDTAGRATADRLYPNTVTRIAAKGGVVRTGVNGKAYVAPAVVFPPGATAGPPAPAAAPARVLPQRCAPGTHVGWRISGVCSVCGALVSGIARKEGPPAEWMTAQTDYDLLPDDVTCSDCSHPLHQAGPCMTCGCTTKLLTIEELDALDRKRWGRS